MSMLDDILDHLIGTTNQAPPGAKPDKAMGLAYTNPKKYNWERKGKGDKIPRMNVMKPVERDMGIQIAKLKPTPAGGSRLVSSADEHHVRHRELLDLFKTLGGGERVQP